MTAHIDAIEHELTAIRELVRAANEKWAESHDGVRLIDLGLVSVKLQTAKLHCDAIRKECN